MKSFFQLQLFYSIFTNLITKSKQGIKIFLSFIKSVKIIEGQDIGKYFAFALSFYAAVIHIDGTFPSLSQNLDYIQYIEYSNRNFKRFDIVCYTRYTLGKPFE